MRIGQLFNTVLLLITVIGGAAAAQESDDEIEEIITVGSQIKGASISDALAVSVMTAADIEGIGFDSGDELLQFMAEQGSNFYTEAENLSGGVNSARGDVGAYNLRNLGTGNTLVLLNGRRMVNMASYQTELTGGSFIPVNSVNSQALPVSGIERMEVLRDGASAIYGADAVAGVVNYVMKTDFEGFSIRAKYADWEGLPRNDKTLTVEWGKNFNDDRTNLSIFANYYQRDPVRSNDDDRWGYDDYRRLLPANSPWAEPNCTGRTVNGGSNACTVFLNSSTNSEFGQYDIIPSINPSSNRDRYGLIAAGITDSAGEFQVYPLGDPACAGGWAFNSVVCGEPDSQPIYRFNNNEGRNLKSDLNRTNLFVYLNHDFGNGLESFTEFSMYRSDTVSIREGNTRLSAVANYVIPATSYWNPFGVCGSPNRLPFSLIGDDTNGGVPCAGLDVQIDNYRWLQGPRTIDNDGEDYRVLQGFRGSMGEWDWETAAFWSRSTKSDVTSGRISNTVITEMLADPTPSAFNPFVGRDSDITPALITVYRDNETEIKSVDFKVSTNDLLEMPAGPMGMVAGLEFRNESFIDDRDPRLDGTIDFTDADGQMFPYVSDVMGSSPSSDSKGDRDVTSAFAELQIPLFSTLDVQLAVRYEDFSDIGDTTVGKIAFGWRPLEAILLRGSWSEAYRVPNLVTVNESDVARSNTNTDYACQYAIGNASCVYGMQRIAGGSDQLVPEESTNTSIGIVIDATPNLTFTLDYWSIEKDNTVGLFGETNHTALDLLRLIEAGTASCSSAGGPSANAAVIREDTSSLSQPEIDAYLAAGICPVGDVQRVEDTYANLDTRTVGGHDIGVYYTRDTRAGTFDVSYVGAFLDEYEQGASGPAEELLQAIDSGVLPAGLSVQGFSNLVRQDGNPREKQTIRASWRKNDWGATVSGVYVSDFILTELTFDDGNGPLYVVPSMTTYNASLDYRFDTFGDTRARVRFGIVNLTNERAPLADQRFGFWSDVHDDMPRSYYIDIKLNF